MTRATWSPSSCRFGLGGGSMGKMEYLLGGALGVIILGSLGMSIYFMFRDPPPPPAASTMYKCSVPTCGHEFEYDYKKEMARNQQDPNFRPPMMDMMGPQAKDCPKCKAQLSCYLMHRCYKCGKYWPMAESERPPMPGQGPPKPVSGGQVCPACGQDQIQWLRENLKR